MKVNIDGTDNGIWLARTDADKVAGSADTSHKQDGLHVKASTRKKFIIG